MAGPSRNRTALKKPSPIYYIMHSKHQLALACFTRTHSQNKETWCMIERWTHCAAYSLSCNRRVVLQRKFQATWNEGWWLRLLISNLIHLQKCHRCCQKMRPLPCIPDRIDRCSEIKNHTFINCTLHMSPCVNANVLQAYGIWDHNEYSMAFWGHLPTFLSKSCGGTDLYNFDCMHDDRRFTIATSKASKG